MRQLQQGSSRESRSGDAPQLHRRATRVEAGGSLRRLRGGNARPAGRPPRPQAEVGARSAFAGRSLTRDREAVAFRIFAIGIRTRGLRSCGICIGAYESAPEARTTMNRWVSRSSSGRRTSARLRCFWSAISRCSSMIRGSSYRTGSTSIGSSGTWFVGVPRCSRAPWGRSTTCFATLRVRTQTECRSPRRSSARSPYAARSSASNWAS